MSISSETRKAGPYLCNGAADVFSFNFKVFSSADVRVVLSDADGVESDLVLATDYVVTLNDDQDALPGGTITTLLQYATGYKITLTSDVALTQPLTLTNLGGFFPEVINDAFDRVTILLQQLAEQVARSVKTDISESLSPDDLITVITTSASTASAAAVTASAAADAAEVAQAAAEAAAAAAAAIADPVHTQTHIATSKATPVDADEIPLVDSAAAWALKKLTWANLKATLKSYFDTLYQPVGVVGFETGMVLSFDGAEADVPSGWILSDGRTIGDGSSGATNRANADCEALFTRYWNRYTNTECPVPAGRGASAAADWAAHKTITVPDRRGRVDAGKDNMGGTAANLLTTAGSGIVGTTLGASGGVQSVTLTSAQSGLPSHSHSAGSLTAAATSGGGGGSATQAFLADGGASSVAVSGSTASAGGTSASSAHTNAPPTIITNKIIKL